MAECMEVLNQAVIEEQQEELTVLQSIFQDDLQILQGGGGQGNICFNLTVKVNIPFKRIDFEAIIPVPGEAIEERSTRDGSSYSDNEPGGTHPNDDEENPATNDSENHFDTLQNDQKRAPALRVKTRTFPVPLTVLLGAQNLVFRGPCPCSTGMCELTCNT